MAKETEEKGGKPTDTDGGDDEKFEAAATALLSDVDTRLEKSAKDIRGDLEKSTDETSKRFDTLEKDVSGRFDKLEKAVKSGVSVKPNFDKRKTLFEAVGLAVEFAVESQCRAKLPDLPKERTADTFAERYGVFGERLNEYFPLTSFTGAVPDAAGQARQNQQPALLPINLIDMLIQETQSFNAIRDAMAPGIVVPTGQAIDMPTAAGAGGGWQVDGALAVAANPGLGSRRIEMHSHTASVGISPNLMFRSPIDIGSTVVDTITRRMALTEAEAMAVGNGTGRPFGLTTRGADGLTPAKEIQAGLNSDATNWAEGKFNPTHEVNASAILKAIVKARGSLPDDARMEAVVFMHPLVKYNLLMNAADGGGFRYFQIDPASGDMRILGTPVYEVSPMTDGTTGEIANNKYFAVVCGRTAYRIIDGSEIRMVVSEATSFPNIDMSFQKWVGGKMVDPTRAIGIER